MRADQLLLAKKLAPTRSAAQRLIDGRAVQYAQANDWQTVTKAGQSLPETCQLRIIDNAETRYVSRGGLKLAGALKLTGVTVKNAVCLDVGQSTGGFTDVLLRLSVARVVGVDVGHGQLHARLRGDGRVLCLEGVNARNAAELKAHAPSTGFDVVVGDVSFISLTLLLPALVQVMGRGASLLHLVKPQFELQPGQLARGGLVKDTALYATVEARIRAACADCGLQVRDYFASSIAGGDGNGEFFVWAENSQAE